MANMFDSMNPYERAELLEARSVPELVKKLKEIKKPIKVLEWISHANKIYALIIGDVKVQRKKKKTTTKGEL